MPAGLCKRWTQLGKYAMTKSALFLLLLGLGVGGCKKKSESMVDSLPFFGEMTYITDADGKVDSSVLALPEWSFINQNGDSLDSKNLKGKIRISDFFFTSCPTICPRMSGQMLRIQNKFKGDNRLVLLSFSIDARHDTAEVLKMYAEKLGADPMQWQFLSGEQDLIFELAAAHGSFAEADANAPGGFSHSGALILSDSQNRVRGMYDGTNPKEVDKLMADLKILFNEPREFGPSTLPFENELHHE